MSEEGEVGRGGEEKGRREGRKRDRRNLESGRKEGTESEEGVREMRELGGYQNEEDR